MFRLLRYPPKFKEDLAARKLSRKPPFSSMRRPTIHYTYLMRMAENFSTEGTVLGKAIGSYYRFAARRYGLRYGMQIPYQVEPGPGLFIVHPGSIIVNGKARIGSNCRLHAGVNIGESSKGVPQIGDNVYIGPGAKIFGNVTIGDNVKIGANAVVRRSVPSEAVVYGPEGRVALTEETTNERVVDFESRKDSVRVSNESEA